MTNQVTMRSKSSHHAHSHIRSGCRRLLSLLPHAETAYAPAWALAHDMGIPQAKLNRSIILLRKAGYGVVSRGSGHSVAYAIPAACWARAQADAAQDD